MDKAGEVSVTSQALLPFSMVGLAKQESPVVVEAMGGQCQVVGVEPRPGGTWRAGEDTSVLAPESVSSSLREHLITRP